MARYEFPRGCRFAFSVYDDSDVATCDNVRPIYELLAELGMRTTKTAWPFALETGDSNFVSSQTLEDEDYLSFVRSLKEAGFEIAWHGASMETSERARTLAGFKRFQDLIGHTPRLHANHAYNRENLYWGPDRFDLGALRLLSRLAGGFRRGDSLGHVQDSDYWWGDLSLRHIEYARNLTFNRINISSVNPTLPYHDPRRPLVPFWFSSSDAESVTEFNQLTTSRNQDRLEREGGVCIVATHFGKGFVNDGTVDSVTRRNLVELASRPGWFPPVGEL